jgi:hypothetical protein
MYFEGRGLLLLLQGDQRGQVCVCAVGPRMRLLRGWMTRKEALKQHFKQQLRQQVQQQVGGLLYLVRLLRRRIVARSTHHLFAHNIYYLESRGLLLLLQEDRRRKISLYIYVYIYISIYTYI